MPKIFFGDTKYAAIKNNWVNDKAGVFVKLSQKNLISLLNIKGTQKIAQVMKELVEFNLIIYTQVGLSKCNKIYLFPQPRGACG